MRVKRLAAPVETEPPRSGEDAADCVACNTPDDAYIWVDERWRVRAMDRPTGLPMVLILECRSHLDLGDLPNLLAAELGVMTVRLERAIRSLDGVARVHVNRWGDGSAHLHMWFLARPYGRLQLRGTFLSLWDDILPIMPERQWRENLALVAAWLADFGGSANAEPPHIQWQAPSRFSESPILRIDEDDEDASSVDAWRPADLGEIEELGANGREGDTTEAGAEGNTIRLGSAGAEGGSVGAGAAKDGAGSAGDEDGSAGSGTAEDKGGTASADDEGDRVSGDSAASGDEVLRRTSEPLWRSGAAPTPGRIGRQVDRSDSADQRDLADVSANDRPSGAERAASSGGDRPERDATGGATTRAPAQTTRP